MRKPLTEYPAVERMIVMVNPSNKQTAAAAWRDVDIVIKNPFMPNDCSDKARFSSSVQKLEEGTVGGMDLFNLGFGWAKTKGV